MDQELDVVAFTTQQAAVTRFYKEKNLAYQTFAEKNEAYESAKAQLMQLLQPKQTKGKREAASA